jgi:preprotein translocase subunit YajC
VAFRVGILVIDRWLGVLTDNGVLDSVWLIGDLGQWITDLGMLPPLVLMGLFFYLFILRPQGRQQKTHKAMLDGLKKNDRVVTIGGIRGTVVSVNREADEVVLRVDENAKLRMTVGAIARVEGDDAKKGES